MEVIALVVSVLTFMISMSLAHYLARIYGDVAGAKLVIDFEKQKVAENQLQIEKGALASLKGELNRSKALCKYNASLKTKSLPPFIRFPTTATLHIAFEERHKYPGLRELVDDVETYTLAIIHVNQLMELHDLLWISQLPATGVDEGAQSRRGKLQLQIADLCAGVEKIEGVGSENFVTLPQFIDHLESRVRGL